MEFFDSEKFLNRERISRQIFTKNYVNIKKVKDSNLTQIPNSHHSTVMDPGFAQVGEPSSGPPQ